MGRRVRRRLLTVVVLAGLVVGMGTVGVGRVAVAAPVVSAANGYLNETAQAGFSFVTFGFGSVPTNASVAVKFFDSDAIAHTFTLLNWSDRQVPNAYSTPQIGALIHRYGALVNLTVASLGATAYGNFTAPSSKGYFEFVCLEAGHFTEGMYGFVAFGEPLPSNLTRGGGLPGVGLAVFIIVGTIVALTVLAIVLGFVVGQRRGAHDEMPPERLGYPEPPSTTAAPLLSRPPGPPR